MLRRRSRAAGSSSRGSRGRTQPPAAAGSCGVLVEELAERAADPRGGVPNHQSHRVGKPGTGAAARRPRDSRVRERLFARTPAALESSQEVLLDVLTAEVQRAVAVFAGPADRGPEQQVVGVELGETLIARAVLVDQRAIPRAEDRGGDRSVAAFRRENEAKIASDDPLAQQREETPRLHGHTEGTAHVDYLHGRARSPAPFSDGHDHRPVAIGFCEQARPHWMMEESRVRSTLYEVEPPWILELKQPHRGAPPLDDAARGRAPWTSGSRTRREHARYIADGTSTIAGRGSSAARIANPIGPRSDARYFEIDIRPLRISPSETGMSVSARTHRTPGRPRSATIRSPFTSCQSR